MTQENFIAEYKALQTKIQEIEDRMSVLKEEYIKSLPFKVGDCVKINHRRTPMEKAWITQIHIYDWRLERPQLWVVRPKKDGTPSIRQERVWWDITPDDVEVLEAATPLP